MKNYFKNIIESIISVLYGMKVTIVHLFGRPVTLQYPVEKKVIPARARNRLSNKIEDCLGCSLCAKACPVGCITVSTEKRDADEPPAYSSSGRQRKLRVTQFDLDMSLCCFCGLCTNACEMGSLVMTEDYEYSTYNKKDLTYHFAKEKARKPPKEKIKPQKDVAKVAAQNDAALNKG